MAKKPPSNESEGSRSVLHLIDENTKGSERAVLFRAVAERIRTGILDASEASLIAGWFDQLAEGKDPKKVLYGERRGRPPGRTGTKVYDGPMAPRLPDHLDLCWIMRKAISQYPREKVFEAFAKTYHVDAEYIARIWREKSPLLAPDPDLQK